MELPVFRTVIEAYGFVWRERRRLWLLAVPGILIATLSDATLMILTRVSPAFQPLGFVDLIVDAVIIVLYSVAWHRTYLMSDQSVDVASAYRWQPRHTKFLLFSGALMLVMATLLILNIIATTIISPHVAKGITFGALLLVLAWVSSRLSMLFPAAAVDEPMRYSTCWSFTRGHGWSLFWIIFLSALLIWLVIVPMLFATSIATLIASILVGGLGRSLTVILVWALLMHIVGFISIAVGISALSIAYRRLRTFLMELDEQKTT